MLRMTLLRPRDMILGKLFALCVSVSPLLAAAIFSCIPLLFLGARNWTMLGAGYGTLIVCTFLSISLALTASLLSRRTSAALVLGYVLSLICFVGLWLGARALGADEDFASLLSPVGAYIRSADLGYYAGQSAGIRLGYWAFAMALWVSITVALLAGSIALFKRYRMTDR